MAMNMVGMDGLPDYLQPVCSYHANILQQSTRVFFSNHMNPPRNVLSPTYERLQDWRGLAEALDFAPLDIENFRLNDNPTDKLFGQWIIQPDATIGQLLAALCTIERFDVLYNETFRVKLENDVRQHEQRVLRDQQNAARSEPVQVPEVASSMEINEFRHITINEVATDKPEYFDAFVCYTSSDFDFVKEMMNKLEGVHGLKLCIPQRDLVAGCAYHVVMTELIKERCRKMIIILSPDYTKSDECDFQTRFAFSLSPGAKEKKLIPVIIQHCHVPSILNHICLLDYTKCDVIDWFWERLAKSLKKDCEYTPTSAILGSFQTNAGSTTQLSGAQRMSSVCPDNGDTGFAGSSTSIFSRFANNNTTGSVASTRSGSPRQGTSSSTVSTISDLGQAMAAQSSMAYSSTNFEMHQMPDSEDSRLSQRTKSPKKKQGKMNAWQMFSRK
jgi:myeloid differentiation primary response protein MyD88